jgi:hypothetical protein
MVRDDWGFSLGYSPDGLVGDDGLIEVKCRRQKKHLQTILADEVPPENMAQLQCGLLVSGREWIDYVSYCGGMPMYVKRVYPDTAVVRRHRGSGDHVRGQRCTHGRGLRDGNQGTRADRARAGTGDECCDEDCKRRGACGCTVTRTGPVFTATSVEC